MHVRLTGAAYDEQRELEMRSILSLLIRKSRVRRWHRQTTCLHVRLTGAAYDEQRELEMRSILSLLIRKSRVRRVERRVYIIWMKTTR